MKKQSFNLSKVEGIPSPRGRARVGADCTPSEYRISPSLEFVGSPQLTNKFFSLPRKDRRVAFTFAEVLITLGVIGVVSAITMPTVLQNYKKHLIETKLKQNVSILQQALVHSSADNGTPDTWELNGWDNENFNIYFKPYINVVKTCDLINTDINNECYSKIINPDGTVAIAYAKKYILNNGSSLIFVHAGNYGYRRFVLYIVPLNKKEELILGKNVFPFNLVVGKRYAITSTRDYPTDDSFSFCKISFATLKNYCLNGSGTVGYARGIGCSALIECNNWKFPKDYPIRL